MPCRQILIFGNSGSGKSTLAKALAIRHDLDHLDLDTLAWQPTEPPQRSELSQVNALLDAFVERNAEQNRGWVVEGCYTDLLELLSEKAGHIVFMNLAVTACIANAKARPWEPHKYSSKAAQDANVEMLLEWIGQYSSREDEFSYAAHLGFYDRFQGRKTILTANTDVVDVVI
ncbi:AAA family ATPase [uncultured Zhongshania sp.]|uniref:AAA family ATPase n=1 Tax=uncultured Zhongshania sp. TaxID=1642288 RepID=UPI0030D8CA0F|tara:strand:- start:601 stop:1119 length:519 start_codon:yes stop_codon:yes gene_type:complete